MTAERFVTSWRIDCRRELTLNYLSRHMLWSAANAFKLASSVLRKEVKFRKVSKPPGADSIRSCSIRAKRLDARKSQVVAYRLRPRNKTKLEYIRHLIAQKRIVYGRRSTFFFIGNYLMIENYPTNTLFNVFFPFSFQNQTSGKWLSTLNCRPTHRKKGKRVAQSSQ